MIWSNISLVSWLPNKFYKRYIYTTSHNWPFKSRNKVKDIFKTWMVRAAEKSPEFLQMIAEMQIYGFQLDDPTLIKI